MFFCCFKQKTAYELRISDWSSDVCSSDLKLNFGCSPGASKRRAAANSSSAHSGSSRSLHRVAGRPPGVEQRFPVPLDQGLAVEIGRASCRERVCQYV